MQALDIPAWPGAQSTFVGHVPVLQAVVGAHAKQLRRGAGAPAVQVWRALQVRLVSSEALASHDAVPQSESVAGSRRKTAAFGIASAHGRQMAYGWWPDNPRKDAE
jgi:hypothetical protein